MLGSALVVQFLWPSTTYLGLGHCRETFGIADEISVWTDLSRLKVLCGVQAMVSAGHSAVWDQEASSAIMRHLQFPDVSMPKCQLEGIVNDLVEFYKLCSFHRA